ncbi:UDP-N-acetylmuramoyl-tripeptide--D-alanyl-D-alanine ligase [bacterium]|nr:UDP-N-acetylmuramoyl-tripeptide--D-alanyl-D-alanine ligase [bacterium]
MTTFTLKDFQKIGRVENFTTDASGVSTDSRSVQAGQAFFAIKGENFDGHDFVKAAFEKQAAIGVVSESWFAQNGKNFPAKSFVVTSDPLKALQNLAKLHRLKFDASVIAVTGSNGKTTCKEMIQAVVSPSYETLATQGNLNNEIGVPLTLLRMNESTQMAIIEMGADKKGDIALLCDIAKPDSGVITNIGKAHVGNFGNIETVAATKAELFDALTDDGVRYVNVDDPRLRQHADRKKGLVTFGIEQEADYRGNILSIDEKARVRLKITTPEHYELTMQLQTPGKHQAYNALIACAIGCSIDLDFHDITAAIEAYRPLSNRMGLRERNGYTVIDDTYNASPESMRAAIESLATMSTAGRKIAVLSDMLELGNESANEHYKLGEFLKTQHIDHIMITGKESAKIKEGNSAAQFFNTKHELIDALKKIVKTGDAILVKGSRGMKMEEIVEAL